MSSICKADMVDRPRLSDEFVERLDAVLQSDFGYPENAVEDTKTATKLEWLIDEIEGMDE